MKKEIVARYCNNYWHGNKIISLVGKITEGPENLLDRSIRLRITFEELEHLVDIMNEAKDKLVRLNAKLEAQNKENDI